MALKPDRIENAYDYDINFYMDEVAERGGVVVLQTAGSGGYPGDPNSVVTYATSPSGRFPVGMLLCDFVNLDLSRFHLNWYREQVPVGYKAVLIRRGLFNTNMIVPGDAPVGGGVAYLGPSGLLTVTKTATGGFTNPAVGFFRGTLDEDGYASVYLEL